MKLQTILSSPDSPDRSAALAAAPLKHLRPKRDFYLEKKLREEGGRSIAVTSVISNVLYEASFDEHFHRHRLFSFMLETDRDGYVIPNTSAASLNPVPAAQFSPSVRPFWGVYVLK